MSITQTASLDKVVKATAKLSEAGDRMTHLCICPMSEDIIRAALELAAEHDYPAILIPDRNQVSENEGGGFVMGLTPQSLVEKIERVEQSIGVGSGSKQPWLRYVCLDHCGLWCRWYGKDERELKEKEAVEAVKKTLTACLLADYAAMHFDCSFPAPAHIKIDEEKIIKLNAELIEFTEKERIGLGKPPIAYEVGTEETVGRGISADHFRDSISKTFAELEKKRLPKPIFFVGRTGARIAMLENVDHFDYTSAGSLPQVTREFGMGFKEHNADYLNSVVLSLHPDYGITGVNIGPCLAATQARAMLDLAAMEEKEMAEGKSDLYRIMSDAVLEKAPFSKWYRKEDNWTVEELRNMPAELKAVTLLAAFYIFSDEQVKQATQHLYDNLKKHSIVENPDHYVISAVKKDIMQYVDAFNLGGGTSRILAVLN